jgi:hypothetical protein
MIDIHKSFAEKELSEVIGQHDLEAKYSIGDSQGDHVSYVGTLDHGDLLNALTKILETDNSYSKREKSNLLATANNWLCRLEYYMEFHVDRSYMGINSSYSRDFVDMLPVYHHDSLLDHVLTDNLQESIEKQLIEVLNIVSNTVRGAASRSCSKLSDISMNLYDNEETLKRSYKTENFIVEVHEVQIDDLDHIFNIDMDGLDYDEHIHEMLKDLADNKYRAFDLRVDVSVVLNKSKVLLGRQHLCGNLEKTDARHGGSNLCDVASEAIDEAREALKQFQKIAA